MDGAHARRVACRCSHCGSYDVWARRPRGSGAQERDQHAFIGGGTAKGGAGGGGGDGRGDAPELATETTRYRGWIRAIDVGSLVALLGLLIALALRLWLSAKGLGCWLAAVVLASYVAADFVSGMFHWMGDTWGTPETPVVGKVFVRPFREHHVDPRAITRHDFIEVNGGNCLISLPLATAAHFIPFGPGAPRLTLLAAFLCTFLVWIFATNQFHKWAHAAEPPPLARLLQRWNVILRPEHHQIHHAAPYDRCYCITTGWLNEPLHRLRLFPALEQVVSRMAGWRPHYTTASGHDPA